MTWIRRKLSKDSEDMAMHVAGEGGVPRQPCEAVTHRAGLRAPVRPGAHPRWIGKLWRTRSRKCRGLTCLCRATLLLLLAEETPGGQGGMEIKFKVIFFSGLQSRTLPHASVLFCWWILHTLFSFFYLVRDVYLFSAPGTFFYYFIEKIFPLMSFILSRNCIKIFNFLF